MAVNANTVESYDNSVIREDLQEAFSLISPEEVPLMTMARRGSVTQKSFEWPVVELAALDTANRVIEGEDAPAVDTGTLAKRLRNDTQISDKVVSVSNTSESSDAAANNIQRLSQQVALKIREMKREMEYMLLQNVVTTPGSSGNARQTAGLPAFIRTNTIFESGGSDPTLSGTTEGYPDAAAGDGTTPVKLTEASFNDLSEEVWQSGGNVEYAMVNAKNKRLISTFTGSSTRYKDAVDRRIVNAVDVYTSDFNEITIIPNRFQPTLNDGGDDDNYALYMLDPEYIEIVFLETLKQKPLAETGHSKKRLVYAEYGLKVLNEAALGIRRDLTNVAS